MNTTQLQYEIDAWFRVLAFLKEENVYLKNRLAGIMQITIGKDYLSQAEIFQNCFINNDTLVVLLKNDISKHEHQLSKEGLLDGRLRKVLDNQKIFREDMDKLEVEFSRLKVEFNNYVEEVISNYQYA